MNSKFNKEKAFLEYDNFIKLRCDRIIFFVHNNSTCGS